MTETKLMLYVWHNVFDDYSHGVAFAIAKNIDQARELIKQSDGYDPSDVHMNAFIDGQLEGPYEIYDKPFGHYLWGGG